MILLAMEVALSVDASVVLAKWLVERNSDPRRTLQPGQ